MKFKHVTLLALSAAGFCVGCGNKTTADQKFLNDVNDALSKSQQVINTCSDAVNAVKPTYDIESYQLENKNDCFAFDIKAKQFVIMNGDDIVCAPKNYQRNNDSYAYFKFTNAYDASSIYSQYLTKDFKGADLLVVTTGLDMGSNWNVKNIIYNNTSTIEKNIVLNTFSDYLTITAPTDNIIHYGDANNVFITEMGEGHEFHANGVYAYLQPSSGHIYLESGSETDLFELKEESTATVSAEIGATVTAAINAPMVPTQLDLNYIEVDNYTDIVDADKEPVNNLTNFFRLTEDVVFEPNDVSTKAIWQVNNDFFLDLNGNKISFTGNANKKYTVDDENYFPAILLDPIHLGRTGPLECYIIDTQPTLYERPSIELNDCSIVIAGNSEDASTLNITSGRIHDIRGTLAPGSGVVSNRPAVLVLGDTATTESRPAYHSFFNMYGGYIRNSEGVNFSSDPAAFTASFKCIQPRGEGATINMSYGDLYSRCYCISGQGNSNGTFNKFQGTEVNISGGTLVGGLGKYSGLTQDDIYTPLFFPQAGKLNITGGNITGPTCLDAKCGDITISGGTFTATREFVSGLKPDNDEGGSTADGSVLLLESNAPYAGGAINLTVDNATMISQHGFITNVIGKTDYGFKKVNVTHNGGTYYYAQGEGTRIDSDITSGYVTINRNGGTWIPNNR